jgi:hypothetical protein
VTIGQWSGPGRTRWAAGAEASDSAKATASAGVDGVRNTLECVAIRRTEASTGSLTAMRSWPTSRGANHALTRAADSDSAGR